MPDDSVRERFWSRVNKDGECWLWFGATNDRGYGYIQVGARLVRVHRLSYEMANGEIAPGLVLRHLCHVRHCVRPDHLIPGTQKENAKDMVDAGRTATGERNGQAKLTEEKVRSIKQLLKKRSRREVAERFDVSVSTITRIDRGILWASVQ